MEIEIFLMIGNFTLMTLNKCICYFPSNLDSSIYSCQWSIISGFWLKIFQSENDPPSISINLGFAKFYPPRSDPYKPNSLIIETFDFYGPFKALLFTIDHSDIVILAKYLIEGQKLWQQYCKKSPSDYHCIAFEKTNSIFEKEISFDASPQEIKIHYFDNNNNNNNASDIIIPLSSIKYIRPLLYDFEGRELEMKFTNTDGESQLFILFSSNDSLLNCVSTVQSFLIKKIKTMDV